MLYDINQHNIVKQLSSNSKIFFKKKLSQKKRKLKNRTPMFSQCGNELQRTSLCHIILCFRFIMSKYFLINGKRKKKCKVKKKSLVGISLSIPQNSGCSVDATHPHPHLPAWAWITKWADLAHVMRLPLNSSKQRHLNFQCQL